jgi:phenylacetic acid degradation protein PaaD
MTEATDNLAQRAADAMWSGDHATQGLGMTLVSVTAGAAVISMPVRQDMVNGHGLCHGGFIFTLADSAFAFACNSGNQVTVAAGARIDFLKSAKLEDVLTATAQVVHQGKRTGVYDVQVVNQLGQVVAEFRGNSATIGGALVASDEGAS